LILFFGHHNRETERETETERERKKERERRIRTGNLEGGKMSRNEVEAEGRSLVYSIHFHYL
jgi:hypothetical protein